MIVGKLKHISFLRMPSNGKRRGQYGRGEPKDSHPGHIPETGYSSGRQQSLNSRNNPFSGSSEWGAGKGKQDKNAREIKRAYVNASNSGNRQAPNLGQTDKSQTSNNSRRGNTVLNSTDIINDKREMTLCVSELMQAVDTAKNDYIKRQSQIDYLNRYKSGADNWGASSAGREGHSKGTFEISSLVERICKSRLPIREPSWSKEVTAALLTICYIPEEWLRPNDYANCSRLITRASTNKQLNLNGIEVVNVLFY